MSYIGRGVDAISNVEKLTNITFDGSTTYNLVKDSVAFTPSGKNNILISIDGVVQQNNFTVSGSTIIFDWSPASSNTCNWIQHYGVGVLNTPADDTVKTATVQDDAITTDKLANSINAEITANTAKTSNATHSGEVTGATALTIADNIVDEANLKVSNAPTNGHMLTAQSGNTGGLTWAAAGGGKLLQVQSYGNQTAVNTTSASYQTTGILDAITCSATSSKVLVICSVNMAAYGAAHLQYPQFALFRDSTEISDRQISGRADSVGNFQFGDNIVFTILDSPSSTSAVTYTVKMRNNSSYGGTIYINDDGDSSITLMEIGA